MKLQRCAVKVGVLDQGQISPHSQIWASAHLRGDFLARSHAVDMLLHATSVTVMQILLGGGHCLWGAPSSHTGVLSAAWESCGAQAHLNSMLLRGNH